MGEKKSDVSDASKNQTWLKYVEVFNISKKWFSKDVGSLKRGGFPKMALFAVENVTAAIGGDSTWNTTGI